MSNDNTFDPSRTSAAGRPASWATSSVSSPFEPGSVNKIVTAASVIEYGLTNPDEVLQVPGSHRHGRASPSATPGSHGVMPYTTTGVFGKSSNVGTLMLAQRVGPERYADMLEQVRPRSAHRRRPARRERRPGARRSTSGRAAPSPTCRSDRAFR